MGFDVGTKADIDRLWRDIATSASIGTGRPGGLSRLTLDDSDKEMRDRFCEWCVEAGLTVEIDELGSIFARREGTHDLPPVYFGSHLDTQVNGGRFDGIVGVLGGLEVMRSLNDAGHVTKRPLVLVNWTNEEGSRFSPPMVASGAFVGRYDPDWVRDLTDDDGKRFGDEVARIGYAGSRPVAGHPVDSYFELHIEQGPELEASGHKVGVVTGGYASYGLRAVFKGRTAHSGPTPMQERRNALVAGARFLTMVDDIGWAEAGNKGKATGSQLLAWPNKPGILSDHAQVVGDVRHPDDDAAKAMRQDMHDAVFKAAERSGCEAVIEDEWFWGGEIFDPELVGLLRSEADRLGLHWCDIRSQAGHDAYYMAQYCPSVMIFTPCRDGITHNNEESCTPEDLAPGLDLLLHAVVKRADR